MPLKSVVIKYTKQAWKGREKLTEDEKASLDFLEQDLLQTAGKPYNRGWQSFGKLDNNNTFHCHITYRKVAVWKIEENGGILDIVFCHFEYIGTREKAPY